MSGGNIAKSDSNHATTKMERVHWKSSNRRLRKSQPGHFRQRSRLYVWKRWKCTNYEHIYASILIRKFTVIRSVLSSWTGKWKEKYGISRCVTKADTNSLALCRSITLSVIERVGDWLYRCWPLRSTSNPQHVFRCFRGTRSRLSVAFGWCQKVEIC